MHWAAEANLIAILEGNEDTNDIAKIADEDAQVKGGSIGEGVELVYELMDEAADDSDYASDYDNSTDEEQEEIFDKIENYSWQKIRT